MTIKTKHRQSGYSVATASQYVNPTKPIHSLSTELEPQQLFEDGKPTGEIIAYKATFKPLKYAITFTLKLMVLRRLNNGI